MTTVGVNLITALLVGAAVNASEGLLVSAPWPQVKPVEESFAIFDPPRAVIKSYIHDESGASAYLFVCRTWEDESIRDIIYAGDLDCRLLEAAWGEIEANLLLETHHPRTAAWYSRGRMFAHELHGVCANYPEYGRVRHFRLRGMKITLVFDNVEFAPTPSGDPPRLKSYILRLKVEQDATALRDIAESSGYLDPSVRKPGQTRDCSVVRRGNEWGDD